MLNVGETTCCRAFETNMGLRSWHILLGVLKTTLRFNERHTELGKAMLPTVAAYHRGRVETKISKGEKHRLPNPGEASLKHLAVVSWRDRSEGTYSPSHDV